MKKRLICLSLFSLILSGCVSAGYHQRKMNQLKKETINHDIEILDRVARKELTPLDAFKLMRYRRDN